MNILGQIGNTPLLKLTQVIESPDVAIYVKCEFLNPGGSIKDRMALRMIEQAEKTGKLQPGGTIVDQSTGKPLSHNWSYRSLVRGGVRPATNLQEPSVSPSRPYRKTCSGARSPHQPTRGSSARPVKKNQGRLHQGRPLRRL